MGSATACHLARRGTRVLGLDRFTPPHAFGSSHGETRIIREAYFEHPVYVPMVQRAYELWRELEKETGTTLLRETGGVMIGNARQRPGERRASQRGAARTAARNADGRARCTSDFPRCIRSPTWWRYGSRAPVCCSRIACITRASGAGATARCRAALRRTDAALGARAETAFACIPTQGEYRAAATDRYCRRMASASLFPDLPLRIERQVLFWFDPAGSSGMFAPDRCPVHLWQFDGRRFFYGFPNFGNGVKVAFHHGGEITTVDAMQRDVEHAEVEDIRCALRRFLPAADGELRATTVCMYTNTPDEHFWIDRDPAHPQVLIASACSGHGFKFSPVIGEILADLVQARQPRFDLSLFARR